MDERERTQNLLQDMVDGGNARAQTERAEGGQLTLGGFIALLELQGEQDRETLGFGKLISYRGYYCDLAFDPDDVFIGDSLKAGSLPTVGDLLVECKAAMGKVFEGYKGGDFQMGESTPLWVSTYGDSTGDKLVGLDSTGKALMPRTEKERHDDEAVAPDPRTPEAIALDRVSTLAARITMELIDEKKALARVQEYRREEQKKREAAEEMVKGVTDLVRKGMGDIDDADTCSSGYLIPLVVWDGLVDLTGLDKKDEGEEVADGTPG